MFAVACEGHGATTLLSTRAIVGVDQADGVIRLTMRCWCGQILTHVTGRNADAPRTDRPVSRVGLVPAAEPSAAAAHFVSRLAVETDPADVWEDMSAGTGRFLLLDTRSAEAYAAAHIPGAISRPHRHMRADDLVELLAAHDAEMFVTYCWRTSCNAATKAAARIASFGLPVKEMIGGIEGWRSEDLPVEGAEVDAPVSA
ncbi:MAG: rhodanese-like domain-containing protein [Acidimicrobiales bacterium]